MELLKICFQGILVLKNVHVRHVVTHLKMQECKGSIMKFNFNSQFSSPLTLCCTAYQYTTDKYK